MFNTLLWSDQNTISLLCAALNDNQVVITTTDTIPGFLAPLTPQGFVTLNDLKRGRSSKAYLILIASAAKISTFADSGNLTPTVTTLIHHCWPGPLTLVCKAKKGLPPFLLSPEGTIALRCPHHKGLQTLLTDFDGLFSTSANLSMQPAPTSIGDIPEALADRVSYVVGEEQETMHDLPSTLLDVSGLSNADNGKEQGKVRVLRQGQYALDDLEDIIGKKMII